ncbi:hypothetical protein OG558_24655 [Kribbella sp. NBC_01510]|uniref:ketopantoate reductase C-terminal domain-containing protein n=1 Tax=Kribbella sp. NBC_01510 TaxID=2903581 RepID=UPI00386A7218
MLQDLEKDKPLELDVILAAVVELADLTGTKAPRCALCTRSQTSSRRRSAPPSPRRHRPAGRQPRAPEPGGSGHSDVGPTCST